MFLRNRMLFLLVLSASLAGESLAATEQKFPDVVSVKARAGKSATFNFDVALSSPYDSAQRYADGFRVTGKDGKVYGERKLWHDHSTEQPFTRDLYDVTIPPDIGTVTIQARDQKYGYGGKTVEVPLPGRK
jgi:hypothetical protein